MSSIKQAPVPLEEVVADLLAALIWAEAALAPFSKEPAEKSGINKVRAAIAKAQLTLDNERHKRAMVGGV